MIAAAIVSVMLVALPPAGGAGRIPLQVIQGEAGNCPIEARYAVAHLWHKNPTMYGWDNEVDRHTKRVWLTYLSTENPRPEGRFLFSSGDLEDGRVLDIIRGLNRPPRAVFLCDDGALFLY